MLTIRSNVEQEASTGKGLVGSTSGSITPVDSCLDCLVPRQVLGEKWLIDAGHPGPG